MEPMRHVMPTSGKPERVNELLRAVNEAVVLLLKSDRDNFEDKLINGLELIAESVDADRIYIWQNRTKESNLYYIRQYEWVNSTGRKNRTVGAKTGFSYAESLPVWEEKFRNGECVNSPVSALTKAERNRLEPYGVRSILAIPVPLKECFWGFVSFDDCHSERTFTDDELDILRYASMAIAIAVIHIEATARHENSKLMLEATPLCCGLWNKNYQLIDCNEAAVKLFRLKNKYEFINWFFDLSPSYQPDGRVSSERALELISEAFRCGRLVFEWVHQRLDGEPIPSEVTLVRVEQGADYIVAAYIRDLREHKRMMKELEQRDVLLQTLNQAATTLLHTEVDEFDAVLMECISMIVKSVDVDQILVWKNFVKDGQLYCEQLYGHSAHQALTVGDGYTKKIMYANNIPGWQEKLSKGMCINGIVSEMSEQEQARLAQRNIKSVLIAPVFLHEHFWGFVGYYDCRRERVFNESEEMILRSGSLLIANAMLRNEMTRDIRDGSVKLQLALDEAKAASRAKSNFLANMSHEIRTPVSAIIGMTAIGKSTPSPEKKNYAFGKIEGASSHLLGVINDILDMSKIEAGKFELAETEFEFEQMLQKVVNIINFRVEEKKQRFLINVGKDIPVSLIGDDWRLTQVLTNLLSNAVKFTPENGYIWLDANLIKDEDGICTLQIKVSDTGVGIRPEQQARLFSCFEQAETNTSRKYGGTGLGLAISKKIVEMMNGEIWYDSVPGKGTKFTFNVQLRKGGQQSGSEPGADRAQEGINMLSVGSEPQVVEYLADIAGRMGVGFTSAPDVGRALELLEGNSIVFIDWNLPDEDVFSLAGVIKARYADRNLQILIPAAEWQRIEDDARAVGVDGFIPKPLFSSAIKACISRHISAMPAQPEAQADEIKSFRGYRVLLAEDIEINREIVMELLEPTQIEIECAENGVEAVEMFCGSPERYDMIFMDVQMPVMDGLEATRRIRKCESPKAKDIPIIAMTANVFREDIESCLGAGMDDHIGKPFDIDELREKIAWYFTNAPQKAY